MQRIVLAYLKAGSRPKKATKVKKEITNIKIATFRRVPILNVEVCEEVSSIKDKASWGRGVVSSSNYILRWLLL